MGNIKIIKGVFDTKLLGSVIVSILRVSDEIWV